MIYQVTLILGDIDHFKRVNDTYGHPAGDSVLKEVSKRVLDNLRVEDGTNVYRYGGEEFAVLLYGFNSTQGQVVAERLNAKMAASPITVTNGENKDLKITMSFGVAQSRLGEHDQRNTLELVEAADRQLYIAKENGRNRVEVE